MSTEFIQSGHSQAPEMPRRAHGSSNDSKDAPVAEHKALADKTLLASRQIDQTMISISHNIAQMLEELGSLENTMQSAQRMLSNTIGKDIPSTSMEYRDRLANLHTTYSYVNSSRICDLQRRLQSSSSRVEIIKERMDKINMDVRQSEYRDLIESQRSQRRHIILWALTSAAILFIYWCASPRSDGGSLKNLMIMGRMTGLNVEAFRSSTTYYEDRGQPIQTQEQGEYHDARLDIFNEL